MDKRVLKPCNGIVLGGNEFAMCAEVFWLVEWKWKKAVDLSK